jgi:hypothetical protein
LHSYNRCNDRDCPATYRSNEIKTKDARWFIDHGSELTYDNRRGKGWARRPDFVLKANKNAGAWMDTIKNISSPADYQELQDMKWEGTLDSLWAEVQANPAAWTDVRQYKLQLQDADFKGPNGEKLWCNVDFAEILAAAAPSMLR